MTRILVIEDEESVRENLVELLQNEHYDTVSAINGQEGAFLALTEPFDLVISDITMPKMDGYALLSILRKDPRTMTLPVIYLTAKTTRESIRSGMDLGAEDYITKPFTRMEILNSIHARLERKKALDESIQEHQADLQQQFTYQMPYEFTTPLSVIISLSESITRRTETYDEQFLKDAGRAIHQSAQVLMDLTRKYIFLADLEQREGVGRGDKCVAVTREAHTLLRDLFQEKTKRSPHLSISYQLEAFVACLAEEDLFRLYEYVIEYVLNQADQASPMNCASSTQLDQKMSRIIFQYSSPASRNPDQLARLNEKYKDNYLIRERMILKRIANLLSCRLEFHPQEKINTITLTIPLE